MFIEKATALVDGVIVVYEPLHLYIVKIDNWFGPKWAWFGGKVLGALGVHAFAQMVIPPFVPNRVVRQECFSRARVDCQFEGISSAPLHINQTSANNFSRVVKREFPNTVFVWYSGNSLKNSRASIMTYWVKNKLGFAWHAGFSHKEQWTLGNTKWIPRPEVQEMLRLSKSV